MSVIADIYYGDYNACKPASKEEFQLEADKKRLEQRAAQFAKRLSDEDKKEFNLIMNSRNEIMSREAFIMFKKGTSLGAEFMNDICSE